MTDQLSKKVVESGLILALIALLLVSTVFVGSEVFAANNGTTRTIVNITNSEPTVNTVELGPLTVDLNPGNRTTINCTGYVTEYNGAVDINLTNATLYYFESGAAGVPDNNFRYSNATCGSCSDLVAPNVSCTCQFPIQYYAYNGTWQCQLNVRDTRNLTSTNISNNITINPLLAIEVPVQINYGNLSVSEMSSMKIANLTNLGNIPLNVSTRGFGGSDESVPNAGNYSFMCDSGYNFSIDTQRYSINQSQTYANMFNISNTTTFIEGLTIPLRENDTERGNSTNSTYWRIQVPVSARGFCNGTLIFSASQAV